MFRKELAVVMPVYNEEQIIAHVIEKWTRELLRLDIDFEIHAYNDGSKDNTLFILNEIANQNKRLNIHNKKNSGHGPTLVQAYRENSDREWIFQIDSDDEIGTEGFEELWEKRDSCNFLIGKRVRHAQPRIRRLISSLSRLSVRTLYGNGIHDVNSPYRLMKSAFFKELFFTLPKNMFAPNVAISGAVSRMKIPIYEKPIRQHPRKYGVVSIKKLKLFKAVVKSLYQTVIFRFKLPGMVYKSAAF